MNSITKRLGIAVIAGMLFATPALACQGPQFETHIILGSPPANADDAEFIGHVDVRNKRKWIFFTADDSEGFLARVTESSTHPELVGTNIELPFIVGTSCGPWLGSGDSGYMAGRLNEQESGRAMLIPKSFRGYEALLAPPLTEPVQPGQDQ